MATRAIPRGDQGLPDIGIIMPILAPFALQSFIETMEPSSLEDGPSPLAFLA